MLSELEFFPELHYGTLLYPKPGETRGVFTVNIYCARAQRIIRVIYARFTYTHLLRYPFSHLNRDQDEGFQLFNIPTQLYRNIRRYVRSRSRYGSSVELSYKKATGLSSFYLSVNQ